MSESTDTSTVKQKPKKVGERLKESIERFLLMRGLTSKDIISMIDDVLANKAIKSNEEEDGDLRKIRERVALILEGLDETEIARIRKQVSLILKGKGVPSLTPLLFISRTLNVRLGTFLDGDSSKIENLRPAICRHQMVKDEVIFGDDNEQLIYHPLSMNKSGVSMEPYIIEMGTPTNIDKLMNDNEFKKKRLERHAGEEFIYVMKGRLVAQVGNETIMLDEGDSIYYHGYLPHHIFSNDRDAQGKPIKKTDILAVVYAPPLEDTLSIKQLNMNNRFGKTLMRLRQMMKLDVAEVSRRTGLKENVITAIEEGGKITSLMPLTDVDDRQLDASLPRHQHEQPQHGAVLHRREHLQRRGIRTGEPRRRGVLLRAGRQDQDLHRQHGKIVHHRQRRVDLSGHDDSIPHPDA